jgi:hypothetical protein
MSQYVRPGSNSTTYVNDVISITTPAGTASFGGVGTTEVVVPDLAYAHTQGTASATWTINHNLDFYPNVTVVDSGGTIVEGEISYTTRNQVVLTFTAAFSGKAYLS